MKKPSISTAYWSISINSICSYANSSPISFHATSANHGMSPEEGLRLINRTDRGEEIRTELVGVISSFEVGRL